MMSAVIMATLYIYICARRGEGDGGRGQPPLFFFRPSRAPEPMVGAMPTVVVVASAPAERTTFTAPKKNLTYAFAALNLGFPIGLVASMCVVFYPTQASEP